jgi:hypothetical protein
VGRFDNPSHGSMSGWNGLFWKAILVIAFLPVLVELALQAVHIVVGPLLVLLGLTFVGRLCLFGWQRHRDEW